MPPPPRCAPGGPQWPRPPALRWQEAGGPRSVPARGGNHGNAVLSIPPCADDSGDEEPASQSDKSELHGPLKTLSSKLEDLSTCNELIAKHGAALQRSLSELESLRLPADSGEKIKAVNERATLFRITSNAMINVSAASPAPPPPPLPPPSLCPPCSLPVAWLVLPRGLAQPGLGTTVRAWEVGKMQLGRGHGYGPH